MKAKLPKLQVKRFNSRLQDWQKFWDSFQSSIDRNDKLFAVNKFSYLKSLVQERVRSTIEGIVLTAVNSDTTVQALKKHYGKDIAIQLAYVTDLLNLPPVYGVRDIARLRKLSHECKSNFRGLKAPRVKQNMYLTIAVQEIAGKLSTDDHNRGRVFNMVNGTNVASLFKGARTEKGSFLGNDLLETFAL